jgi:steroid Delta-isomerase
MQQHVERIVQRFEKLSPDDLARMAELYTEDARFKDPFNEVQGVSAIRGVFEHMYDNLDEPRFVIHERIVQGEQCFLTWDFIFRMRRLNRELQTVRGGSHLRLASDGRITMHRDYWDAAEELYEKLPVLGGLMRWLKQRVNS